MMRRTSISDGLQAGFSVAKATEIGMSEEVLGE